MAHSPHHRRKALAILALLLTLALVWSRPNPSAADTSASPIHLPLVMREGNATTATPTHTATATVTPSATQTTTATVTATATATATSTPTEIPSMICFPTSGTYPIAISADYLDASGFINPDGYYSDGTYQNKTWKRLYMRTNANPSGGFYFLRWKADPTTANQMELTSALTGTGNLSQGFEEAPWPEINPLNLPKPAGYPLAMYQLNPGDWTYVNSSVEGSNNAALRPALDYHVANQTLMILPLSDMVVGTGIHSIYHVSRPGAFLLLSYSTDSLPYLDLVYIEEPPTVSCSG